MFQNILQTYNQHDEQSNVICKPGVSNEALEYTVCDPQRRPTSSIAKKPTKAGN